MKDLSKELDIVYTAMYKINRLSGNKAKFCLIIDNPQTDFKTEICYFGSIYEAKKFAKLYKEADKLHWLEYYNEGDEPFEDTYTYVLIEMKSYSLL